MTFGTVLHHPGNREINPILEIGCVNIFKRLHTQFEKSSVKRVVSEKMRQLAR